MIEWNPTYLASNHIVWEATLAVLVQHLVELLEWLLVYNKGGCIDNRPLAPFVGSFVEEGVVVVGEVVEVVVPIIIS